MSDLGSQAVACVRQDKTLWVATMDRQVSCYSSKGKRLKGIVVSEDISELCVLTLKRAKVNYLLMVALSTGELCIYRDLTMIHSFKVDAPVAALCYGKLPFFLVHCARGIKVLDCVLQLVHGLVWYYGPFMCL